MPNFVGKYSFSCFDVNLFTQPCMYKVLSKDSEVLYIGSSKHGISRFLDNIHLQREVIDSAGRVDVVFFKTRDEALAAERKAISELEPQNNCGGSRYFRERSLIGTEAACVRCGKPFTIKREWHRFCSDDCRNSHWVDGHSTLRTPC